MFTSNLACSISREEVKWAPAGCCACGNRSAHCASAQSPHTRRAKQPGTKSVPALSG